MDKFTFKVLRRFWCAFLLTSVSVVALSNFFAFPAQAVSSQDALAAAGRHVAESSPGWRQPRLQAQGLNLGGVIFGGSAGVIFLLFRLSSWKRRRGSEELSLNIQFAFFFPEECVAELGSLLRRMQKAKVSPWEIRLRLLQEFVSLLWAFHVQIRIENMGLPAGHRKVESLNLPPVDSELESLELQSGECKIDD